MKKTNAEVGDSLFLACSKKKELEKITGANLYSRGNSILVKSTQKKNEIVNNTYDKWKLIIDKNFIKNQA